MVVSGGRWTKGQILSAGCLLSSTFLVMIVSFSAEDIFLFPTKCESCKIVSDEPEEALNKIGNNRPSVQRHPLVDLQNITSLEDSSSNSRPQNTVIRVDPSKEVSEVDPVEKNGQNVGEDDQSEVDIKKTQNEYKSRGESLEIQEDRDRHEEKVDTGKLKVVSEVKEKADSSPSPPPFQPPEVHSVSYYTSKYKHPVAELRLLTAKDGAARLRSKRISPEREISIVTQTSPDRLRAVEAMCTTWSGTMCVAVHVRLESETASVYEKVKNMHARMEEQLACRLDIQLVTEDGFETEEAALAALYPVNALRNVALQMANTELIFLLDADFKPCLGLHENLTEEVTYQELVRQATEDGQLFVVPAFEGEPPDRGHHPKLILPETIEELRDAWANKSIECFHCRQSPTGHMPTKFEKFFDPATTGPYPIAYREGFEPYVIGAREIIPLYDARFRGYGENKISHIYSCAAGGMGFQVLPNVFVFELPHPPSKARDSYVGKHRDPENRYRIKGLYNLFRNEVKKKQMAKDPAAYKQFLRKLGQAD